MKKQKETAEQRWGTSHEMENSVKYNSVKYNSEKNNKEKNNSRKKISREKSSRKNRSRTNSSIKLIDYDVYKMDSKERSKIFMLAAAAGILCGYLYFRSFFACAVFGLASLAVVPMYKKLKADDRKRKLRSQFRDFLYTVSSSVNAGRSLEEAMDEAIGPVRLIHGDGCCMVTELERMNMIIRETNSSAEPLLRDLARRSHLDEISEFVDVCTACRKTGGDMNILILKASDIITQHIELQREKEVILSEKKLESRILALMPPAVILLINISSSDYLSMMYMTATGRLVMAASLLSTIGSFLWSFKLISFD